MVLAFGLALVSELHGQVVTYEVESDKSTFEFMVTHLGMMDVEGSFSGAQGFIDVDMISGTPVQTRITLKSSTVNTDNESRDDEIRSGDFLNTEQYPLIVYESSNFTQQDGTKINAVVSGELTIAGVTKTILSPYILTELENQSENSSILIESEFILSRESFDLEFGRVLDAMVGDEIVVSVTIKGVLKD